MTGPSRPPIRRRGAGAPEVLVELDASDARPLHRQVYDGLREAILAERLASGTRLPSTRVLAADLGVARNTVTVAFEQLRAEGYLESHRGAGTRVRQCIPEALLHVPGANRPRVRPSRAARPPAVLPARGAALVAAGRSFRDEGPPRAFRMGVPAVDAFPAELWARLVARRWRRGGVPLGEGLASGDPALRAAIAGYVAIARGVRCSADQVFVVNGTQQAVDLAARILVAPGDAAWVEDPGYLHARVALRDAGARLVSVPVDAQGLDVGAGERVAPDARLAYVTPSHQFPLGVVMSAPRRLALIDWAHRAGAWIIEDDYDSEFRYGGRPLPSLQGLDVDCQDGRDASRVLYVGTFGKTLVPAFRLAYLILPDALVDVFRSARAALDRFAPTIEQGVLADFIGEGHYARHVRRMRGVYAERQEALLGAAAAELGGRLALAPDAAGLHLVGWLPDGVRDTDATRAAAEAGVDVQPLSRYYMTPATDARGALLLSYAGWNPRAIRAGVRRLSRAAGWR